jgi:hypothetical protein
MSARMLTVLGAVVGASLLSLGGCPGARTCNQGCSNVAQAASKVMSDQIGDLNPDDVQVLTDLAIQYADVTFPPVTDEQANAVVTFLSDNNVQTIDDVQALIQQAEDDPDSIVISDEVRAVIEQIIADPSAYIDAVEEFNETQM